MKTLVHALAVSHWQDPNNWNFRRLRADGVELLSARACRGAHTPDPAFARYHAAARANRLRFGASLVFCPAQASSLQLAAFDRQLSGIGDLRAGDVLPVLELREEAFVRERRARGAAAERIARAWTRRFGGLIVRYSSLFPEWTGARDSGSDWAWLFERGLRHWLVDDHVSAGRPRAPTNTWHLHQYGKRSLAEYAHGEVEVAVSTKNSAHEWCELLVGEASAAMPLEPSPRGSTTTFA
jgi:hypothetical protein